jgi:hypothetical protein
VPRLTRRSTAGVAACRVLFGKLEFVAFHVDPAAAEGHSFRFKSQALFDGRVAAKPDFAARAENPLPGQPDGPMQDRRYAAGVSGISRGARNGTVGRNHAARNPANRGKDAFAHSFRAGGGHHCDRVRLGGFLERLNGFAFAVIYFEDRQQFGHLQQIAHALREVGEFDGTPRIAGRRI